MKDRIKITLRFTPEQHKILQAKAVSSGYKRMAYYIRAMIFNGIPMEDKVDAIYKKICGDEGQHRDASERKEEFLLPK